MPKKFIFRKLHLKMCLGYFLVLNSISAVKIILEPCFLKKITKNIFSSFLSHLPWRSGKPAAPKDIKSLLKAIIEQIRLWILIIPAIKAYGRLLEFLLMLNFQWIFACISQDCKNYTFLGSPPSSYNSSVNMVYTSFESTISELFNECLYVRNDLL